MIPHRPTGKPILKCFARKRWHLSLRRHPNEFFDEIADDWRAIHKVHNSWRESRQPRPDVNQTERVSVDRPESSFLIMREELCFVGGHVHINGAIGLASFAR